MADLSETEMVERLRRLEEEIYGQSPEQATELDGRGEMEFRNLKSVGAKHIGNDNANGEAVQAVWDGLIGVRGPKIR